MAEFTTPEFLQNRSPEDFLAKIKTILPTDIDFSEGGHTYNFSAPAALVGAELCEFILPEVIRLILPEWSYGSYLDGHAKTRNLQRLPAAAASGNLTITGEAHSVIPAGSLFSSAAVNDSPSVDYATLEDATIPTGKTVVVPVQCTQTGIVGNAPANTVVLVSSRLNGILAVTNAEAITGGTEEETDEALKERILYYDETKDYNYGGSASDYKAWASSVAGVGEAVVVPAQDTSGVVTIIVTDANGAPATEQLCARVYDYIMSPGDEDNRLAPVNAQLSVIPPTSMQIGISATIELEESATIASVEEAFRKRLAAYLPVAMDAGEIKYTKIASILSETLGVNDFQDLEIGEKVGGAIAYSTANIPVSSTELPSVTAEDIIFESGTV